MRTHLLAVAVFACPFAAPAQDIVAREGREEFRGVEYIGGDATQPKSRLGWLVLTDSTLSLHECKQQYCAFDKGGKSYEPTPYFVIQLKDLKDISSSSTVRGPGFGSKLALGMFAGDKTEEMVGIIYETTTSAEAPIFKTQKAQSAALEAKIRFRMKKVGLQLKDS